MSNAIQFLKQLEKIVEFEVRNSTQDNEFPRFSSELNPYGFLLAPDLNEDYLGRDIYSDWIESKAKIATDYIGSYVFHNLHNPYEYLGDDINARLFRKVAELVVTSEFEGLFRRELIKATREFLRSNPVNPFQERPKGLLSNQQNEFKSERSEIAVTDRHEEQISNDKFEEKKFTISYDLPVTENHTIDAKTLGVSLVNMADLIAEGDKILNGEHSTVKVNVKANKEGSFEIEFVAWLQSGGIDILKALGITAAAATPASATLFGMIKHLKNRVIKASLLKRSPSTGQMENYLQLDDGSEVKCDKDVQHLLQSHTIRTKLSNIIEKPAKGVENAVIKFIDEERPNEPVLLEEDDIELFRAPPKKTYENTEVITDSVNLVFVQINNTSRNGWKAKRLDDEISVKMDDVGFLARINAKQDFPVKDELFEVVMETTKRIYEGKTTYSYRITEVTRHRTTQDRKIV